MDDTNRGTEQNKHDTASNQNQWIIVTTVIFRFQVNTYMMSLFVSLMQAFFCQIDSQPTLNCGGASKYKGGGGNS